MNAEIKLPDDLFNPARLPPRDVNGFVSHPDADLIYASLGVDDEGAAAWQYIKNLGYENSCCDLETDATEEVSKRYFDSDSPDCSYWEPSRPEGEGWVLGWLTDTDDGPVAVYLRKKL